VLCPTFDWANGSHLSRILITQNLKRPFLALHRIGVFPGTDHSACRVSSYLTISPLPVRFAPDFGGMFLLHCPWASSLDVRLKLHLPRKRKTQHTNRNAYSPSLLATISLPTLCRNGVRTFLSRFPAFWRKNEGNYPLLG